MEGLEKTLKVEVKAGPHARVFEFEPRFRAPGRYDAVFFPTVATTYTYRVFGTIGGAPFDVTFACNPAGHVRGEDRSVVKVSADVTRKGLVGSFGCPRPGARPSFRRHAERAARPGYSVGAASGLATSRPRGASGLRVRRRRGGSGWEASHHAAAAAPAAPSANPATTSSVQCASRTIRETPMASISSTAARLMASRRARGRPDRPTR